MRSVELPGGESVPVLGIGTWYMGDQKSRFDQEVKAVRYAVD
ncbi:MAG: aldo/keto reductase, partial [Rhodospirillales bacterium]|nr:aldo/keto reductase [Rhodospirillales bacterium]